MSDTATISALPTIDFFGHQVARLICGGNPVSGFSHFSSELDWEMVQHYTMPNIQALFDECWRNGINTIQMRSDRHIARAYLEHRMGGGGLQWIAQTATELADVKANIRYALRYGPIAIYHHGTRVDNCWHAGKMEEVGDIIKAIKDTGLPAGMASHIPEVVDFAESKGWPVDFYMTCFYNLAPAPKPAPAVGTAVYDPGLFDEADPPKMVRVIRALKKPCLAFKILAASRRAGSPAEVRKAFDFALSSIKPTDAVVVGMFQKRGNQVAENARIVREILSAR